MVSELVGNERTRTLPGLPCNFAGYLGLFGRLLLGLVLVLVLVLVFVLAVAFVLAAALVGFAISGFFRGCLSFVIL